MEIERKWLINIEDIPYDLTKCEHLDIEQAYISFRPTIRIRKISNKDEYILTIKSPSLDKGLSRQEYEINISSQDYDNLLNRKEGIVLSKTRYRVKQGEYILEIDLFHNEYDGLAYMEVEFESVEKANIYIPPSFVKQELTYNKKFSNASLAKQTFKIEDLLFEKTGD